MKLNARQIDTAKPKEKAYKLADGGGLYLLVKPGGGEYLILPSNSGHAAK